MPVVMNITSSVSYHISTHHNDNKYKNNDECRVQIAYFINDNNVITLYEIHI
jgi:hypothetical protein